MPAGHLSRLTVQTPSSPTGTWSATWIDSEPRLMLTPSLVLGGARPHTEGECGSLWRTIPLENMLATRNSCWALARPSRRVRQTVGSTADMVRTDRDKLDC